MKKLLMVLLSLFFVFSAVACDPVKKSDEVKVGFIYIGDPADGGFTLMHDEGRKYLVEKTGVKTTEVLNVNDTDAQTFDIKVRELIAQGYNVIIACSYGFGQPQHELAKEFPDVTFLHFSGDLPEDTKNMGTYFGKMYEARYVNGAVTGMNIPEGGVVGYAAAYPIPEVIRAINAFTLGLQSTNPTATVKVYWTFTWFDLAIEKAAGDALVAQGVDAIAIHQDTTLAPQAAVDAGKWGIGYHSDMSAFLGDGCLISAVWNLGPYYVNQVEAVKAGTWKAEDTWGGFADGDKNMVMVSKVSPKAVAGSQELADDLVAKLTKGELKIFAGPLYDNTGALRIKEDQEMAPKDIWVMDWFVKGVEVVN